MSDISIVLPAAAIEPDPDRAVSARLDSASVGNILRLLRALFAYGRNLVEKLREEDDPDDIPWYAFLTSIFGTTNPALITVTIIRGLLRATALEARLSGSLARGRDLLLPLPLREDRAAERIDGRRGPARGQPRTAGWTIPPGWPAGDHSLDREPSPEEEMFAEIVAEDRDRPIGAILLDICLDLGIVPDLMDPATWDELRRAITLYGGDPSTLEARAVDYADLAGVGRKAPDLFRGHSARASRIPRGRRHTKSPLLLQENGAAKRIGGGEGRAHNAPQRPHTKARTGPPTAGPAVLIRRMRGQPSPTEPDRTPAAPADQPAPP